MKTCPHDCRRCRAIELGLSGRALTRDEFLQVQGGVVEQVSTNGHWSPETAEAALAVDVAQAAYEEARREFSQVVSDTRGADRLVVRADGSAQQPSSAKEARREDAIRAAQAELDEVGDRLREARRNYRELAGRDSRQHTQEEYAAGQEAQAAERARRIKEARKNRRGVLERLRGDDAA